MPKSPMAKPERNVTFNAQKEKHVAIVEKETLPKERTIEAEARHQNGDRGRKVEFGVPLCREAEIEKWKNSVVKQPERRRRGSWN